MSHYLEQELQKLISDDPKIFEFFRVSSLDGLWYWDLENPEHEWIDDRFWQLLGYDAKDKKHLASEWQNLIYHEDLAVAVTNFEDHLKNPKHKYDQIVRYIHKDGSTVWVRCRGIAIRDESGKPIRMLGAHNDFTQLKKSESGLQNANELLGLILNNTPDLIYVKDTQGNIIKSNISFENFHKNNSEFKKIISQNTYDKSSSKYGDNIALIDGQYQETFSVMHNGLETYFDVLKVCFSNYNNEDFILCIAKDITKQQNLINSLHEKSSDITNLLNSSGSNLLFVNKDYNITQYSNTPDSFLAL